MEPKRAERLGLWYGALASLFFSLTLPATRTAVAFMDPVVVTLGRALVAAVLAALMLWLTRQPWPTRAQWKSLAVIALGVVLGFPLLSAWAMRELPASHGAIVLGLLPLATTGFGALRAGERPSLAFWGASLTGSAAVIGFAVATGAGSLHVADLALLGAVLAAAIGYAEGTQLARTLGSWQVICWALVLAAPFLMLPMGLRVAEYGMAGPLSAWLAFGYVAICSQFIAFFAWYKGLGLGGIARVSQLQLFQPFITMVASWLLWGEQITWVGVVAALVVAATVALGRRAPVARVEGL